MTQEDKELLFKDLSSRLPYGVKCWASYNKFPTTLVEVNADTVGDNLFIVTVKLKKTGLNSPSLIEDIKPYLRPMSSMTEEEQRTLDSMCNGVEMVSRLSGLKMFDKAFDWLNKNKDIIHPLILSSVFHYEFVFIHPFSDGNGRTVRLWQSALLYNWKEIFLYLPIESQIRKYQADYYKVINDCHINGNSNVFINFMLKMIDQTLTYLINRKNVDVNQENINIDKILNVMEKDRFYSATELMQKLNIKSRETLRNKYLTPAIEQKLIKQTNPDKITSKNQQYYKI